MLYLFLSTLAIILSYCAYSSRDKQKSVAYVRWSFAVVFFIYGFEYFNTVDYAVMMYKFNLVNYNIQIPIMFGDKIEPLTTLLMKLCKPIGNVGYYVITALFEIVVLYKIAKGLLPLKYLWLFFVLLLINFDNVIVLMTAKRQVLSLFVTWLGLYIILENSIKHSFKIGAAVIISAILIHTAAVFALLMIPIVKYNYVPGKKLRWVLFGLFFVQFVIDISSYSEFIYIYILGINDKFASYAYDLSGESSVTAVYFLYYLTIYSAVLFNLDKLNQKELVWAKFVILYFLLFNMLPYSAGRSLMYYKLGQLFVIPIIISKIQNYKIKTLVCTFSVLISLRLCYNTFSSSDVSSIGNGFKEFNTIFEAPSLQIDNPSLERDKFKDLRN